MNPPASKPRHRAAAVLLSIGLQGLGELYAGRPLDGLVTFAFVLVCSALSVIAVFALPGLSSVLVPLLIVLSAWTIVLIRADRAARRAPQPYALQPYNRWQWYALAIAVNLFLWRPAVTRFMRSRLIQAFRIPSASMDPTMLVGDFIFISKRPSAHVARTNEIVLFESPGDRLLIVKRVVGMPGDTLAMSKGMLFRNAFAVEEPYTRHADSVPGAQDLGEGLQWHLAHLVHRDRRAYQPDMRNWGPLIVPPDSVFLLGDNRDESFDSRFYGAVGIDRIRGKPLKIYFSVGGGSIRWARIGKQF